MKKRLKIVSFVVMVVMSLSVVLPGSFNEPLVVDAVSAATEASTETSTETKASTTTSSGSFKDGYNILRKGARGESVKLVQTLLNSFGYELEVDGIFGRGTLNAVKDFQSKNGLAADGVVGPKTLAKLNELTATEEPTDTASEVPNTEEETTEPVVVADATNVKMGRVNYAAHGDKSFAVVVAAMVEDKIVGTSIDEFQFMGSDVATGVPSSDGAFGENYPEGTVLGSKRTNTEYYSGNMEKKAGSTVAIHENFNAIEAYATGKTVTELEKILEENTDEQMVDVVSGATLADTKGYLTSILEAAKAALGLVEEEVDVVTTASIKTDAAGLKKAMSEDGAWIIITLNDIVSEEELVLEGTFYNKDDETRNIYRKIAPYTQDDDHNVLERFKITAPKLTVKSPNTRLQAGTFVGDIYVEANGFNLRDAKVDGNVYYTAAEYKGSSLVKQEDVTGVIELVEEVDVVSSASFKYDAEGLKEAMSADGAWIIIPTNDIITDEELVVEGTFYNKNDTTKDLYRKIAPYTQDDDRNVLERFTITAPKLTVKSPNTSLQAGIFVGDIYVEAEGFNLNKDAKVDGNIYFATEELKATFEQNECEVTGEIAVK